MKIDWERRLKTNPTPSMAECLIGRYQELLEYPVRQAVFAAHNKGYLTEQSGFSPSDPTKQFLTIQLGHNPTLRRTLHDLNFVVMVDTMTLLPQGSLTYIEFAPELPDLEHIKLVWDALSDLLPHTGQPPPKNNHPLARFCRIKYAAAQWPKEMEELQEDAKTCEVAARILNRLQKAKP